MKKWIPALLLLATTPALAGSYEWTAGWGMGVSEYQVDDGNDSALSIACPDSAEDGPMRAHASIRGQQYDSAESGGFDVIVDGETYGNPFYTDCRVCAGNFPYFWEALRKANHLQISADGQTVKLPTRNIDQVLRPLDNPENSCRTAW